MLASVHDCCRRATMGLCRSHALNMIRCHPATASYTRMTGQEHDATAKVVSVPCTQQAPTSIELFHRMLCTTSTCFSPSPDRSHTAPVPSCAQLKSQGFMPCICSPDRKRLCAEIVTSVLKVSCTFVPASAWGFHHRLQVHR